MSAARNKATKRNGTNGRDIGFGKMQARTKSLNTWARFFGCCLVFTLACAFLATTLKPYRELGKARTYYEDEIQVQERLAIEQVDEKTRERFAIENDPEYLGLIARDRLNFYKPGEHVFRIEK